MPISIPIKLIKSDSIDIPQCHLTANNAQKSQWESLQILSADQISSLSSSSLVSEQKWGSGVGDRGTTSSLFCPHWPCRFLSFHPHRAKSLWCVANRKNMKPMIKSVFIILGCYFIIFKKKHAVAPKQNIFYEEWF